ncbi:MAG TPA: 2-isopropylmalate synthase [Chloroflexota bacterium]|nr:2-isopropylmalate synthase [Chloroflexota bacterium]
MTDYVTFFDTTLRDGEQALGFALTSPQKVEMAKQLARLRVDVIEAGFPAASPEDFAAVQRIAREVRGPIIAGLARAVAADIEQCWEAIKDAERPRIHTFLPPADVRQPHADTRARAGAMVALARTFTPDVEFSPMDATRSDWAYVSEVLEAAIEAGATTVNIPDTCGFVQPDELGAMITYIREHVANIDRATISVHCHDDLGLAVANSLAAIKAGARQVECCVNGVGERAGNAALEELVMSLTVRRDHHRVDHGINIEELVPTSNLLQQFTGILVQPNKAVVGTNTFGHAGMLEDAHTYAAMSAAAIGADATRLGLGRHSGRHALRARLEELGLLLTQEELNHAFAGFKNLADYKQELTDDDLVQIAHHGRRAADGVFDAIGHVYR